MSNCIAENLSEVLQNIKQCAEKSGRDVSKIQLIAVSKTRSLDEVISVVSLGQNHFGENTVQDAMTKIPYLEQNVQWHFIGHLQSKKAGKLPGYFQWIHSVDSTKLAQKLSTAMLKHSKNSDRDEFIIGTEVGIIHRLKKENPGKIFYPAYNRAICPNMKLTNLEKVLWSLEEERFEIIVPDDIAKKAKTAIDKMIAIR